MVKLEAQGQACSLHTWAFLTKTTINKVPKDSPLSRNFVEVERKRLGRRGVIFEKGIEGHHGTMSWINLV